MASVNKVILVGRLTKDPEIKYLSDGKAVASFSLATSENWKDKSGNKQEKTEFHNVTAFGRLAEIMEEYLKKGALIYLEGKLTTDKLEKDGVTRYSTKVIADQMQMLGSKGESQPKDTKPEPEPFKPSDDFPEDLPF